MKEFSDSKGIKHGSMTIMTVAVTCWPPLMRVILPMIPDMGLGNMRT